MASTPAGETARITCLRSAEHVAATGLAGAQTAPRHSVASRYYQKITEVRAQNAQPRVERICFYICKFLTCGFARRKSALLGGTRFEPALPSFSGTHRVRPRPVRQNAPKRGTKPRLLPPRTFPRRTLRRLSPFVHHCCQVTPKRKRLKASSNTGTNHVFCFRANVFFQILND